MYMGLGQDSVTDLSGVQAMVGSTSDDVTPSSAFTCPSGSTMVNGVCSGGSASASGFTTWLKTGNNGVYAALAVVAAVVVLGMAKR